ncbi:extracellular solute-binding protein [Microbacterium album]|uniref:ABC transporter substrate-binding protein n=1 Tax=Microbacterium album TaxID=2053191 RepID=A0A917IEN4_9MICO|nr:extracellular solute-binding protein [Microbacterium album]GGH45632.1 hypothetical protein GCM10010921_21160 [Microbacterium album]
MKKHAPFTLSALAAGSLVLAGCGGGTAGPGAAVAEAASIDACEPSEVSLTVTFGQQAEEAMEVAVAKLREDYPGVEVSAVASPTSSYDDLTQTIVADIAVGKRPDLIMAGLGQLRFWVDTYDPAPIDVDALPDTYQRQFLPAGTIDGTVYLAPAQISAPVLMVNQDALEAAGAGAAADISDYDAWMAAAEKVTAHTGKPSVSIPTLGLADWFAQAFVQGAGGTFVAPDGSAGFADERGIDALSIWTRMHEAGLELGVVDDQDAWGQFMSGNVPFLVSTTSVVAMLQDAIGDSFQWLPIDLPTVEGVQGPLPAGGNGWIVLSDDACHAAFANELVGNLLSEEGVLAASGEGFSYIPVDTAAAEKLLASPSATPQLTYAWTYDYELTPWGGFDGDVTAQINDSFRTMAQQLQTGADPEATVSGAAATVDSILGQ